MEVDKLGHKLMANTQRSTRCTPDSEGLGCTVEIRPLRQELRARQSWSYQAMYTWCPTVDGTLVPFALGPSVLSNMSETDSSGTSAPRSIRSVDQVFVSPGVLHPFYFDTSNPILYARHDPLPDRYYHISPLITSVLFNLTYLARRIVCASNLFIPGVSYGPLPVTLCDDTVLQLQLPTPPVVLFLGFLANHSPDWEEDQFTRYASEVGQESAEWLQEALARARQPNTISDFIWDVFDLARRRGNPPPTPDAGYPPLHPNLSLSQESFHGSLDELGIPLGLEPMSLDLASDEEEGKRSSPPPTSTPLSCRSPERALTLHPGLSRSTPHRLNPHPTHHPSTSRQTIPHPVWGLAANNQLELYHGGFCTVHVVTETVYLRDVGVQTFLDDSGGGYEVRSWDRMGEGMGYGGAAVGRVRTVVLTAFCWGHASEAEGTHVLWGLHTAQLTVENAG